MGSLGAEDGWLGLTSQHRGLLSSGYSQTLRWPSLTPRGQLFLLHSTEWGWGWGDNTQRSQAAPSTRLPKPRLPTPQQRSQEPKGHGHSPNFLGSTARGSPMVRGPMGALACSEWGTRSCTDIPCQGKGTGHSQTRTQGQPCLGPEDILVRDMALALSGAGLWTDRHRSVHIKDTVRMLCTCVQRGQAGRRGDQSLPHDRHSTSCCSYSSAL